MTIIWINKILITFQITITFIVFSIFTTFIISNKDFQTPVIAISNPDITTFKGKYARSFLKYF